MKKRNFNLLKPIAPPSTAWDKVYEWIIGKARIVILIAELFIATAFIGKVIEDTAAKNKDKNIERLNSEISFYADDLEPTFRKIQAKTFAYSNLWKESNQMQNVMSEVVSYIENPSSAITIAIKGDELTIVGYDNLEPLKKLETAMKSSATFTNVTVSSLSLEGVEIEQGKGTYGLSATIKNSKRPKI